MEMPIFPLGTVLFPGGVLPLKIFEQRYLDMTKACLRDGTSFGICLIREGREVGAPAVPSSVGCIARIREWDMPQLGIFLLITEGTERFRLGGSRIDRSGLLIGEDKLPSSACYHDPAWVAYRLAEFLPLESPARQRLLEMDNADLLVGVVAKLLRQQGLAL